ncbi:MAG: hypothetical protein QXI84_07580 [Thermofilaceae archaeon]
MSQLGGTSLFSILLKCLEAGDWDCVKSVFTDEVHYTAFRLLWEEGLDEPRVVGEYLVFSAARGVVVGVNDDNKLFVNVLGRLFRVGEDVIRDRMGFSRHCLGEECLVAESGRYRVQGDLVAWVELHDSQSSLAKSLAYYLYHAWHNTVHRFVLLSLVRWLAERGYHAMVERRGSRLYLPGLTQVLLNRAAPLIELAARHMSSLLAQAGHNCAEPKAAVDERVVRADAGCLRLSAEARRGGLSILVETRPDDRPLLESILESLEEASPVKIVVGNHVVRGVFVARWRLAVKTNKRRAASSVRGPLVALGPFEVFHRQHGRRVVRPQAMYAVVEFSTARVDRQHAATFNKARLLVEPW